MHAAVLSSLAEGTGEVFSSLAASPGLDESASGQMLLTELVRVSGGPKKGRGLLAVLTFFDGVKEPKLAFSYLSGFADGLQRADVPLALFQTKVQPRNDQPRTAARTSKVPELRVQAIDLLGLTASTTDTMKTLLSVIDAD